MKIGVFDSGIGGLSMQRAISAYLPQYDYVYLGDTARAPYGGRTHDEVYTYTKEGIDFLFEKGCSLVVLACNTASARALRQIQQEYLAVSHPEKKVLGVIIPTAEAVTLDCGSVFRKVGVMATEATVESLTYKIEIQKLDPTADVVQVAAKELVPLIEDGKIQDTGVFLEKYLKELTEQNIQALVLGCTHYSLLEDKIQNIVGEEVKVINQENIIPQKLKDYLSRHKEIDDMLSKNSSIEFYVTKETTHIHELATLWYHKDPKLILVNITKHTT